ANRLLRRHGRALGLGPSFTVMDRTDTADLLALVRSELEPGVPSARRRAPKQTLADILSRCVNSMTPLQEVLTTHFPWCRGERDEIAETFRLYTLRKRATGCLDYDDLLLCWSGLFGSPEVGRLLTTMFDHILVDEYQDTNAIQADILEAMSGGGARITAVGDDAQAIYSFRAATQENIMEFPRRFKARVIILERNHRSTPPLLEATNALIAEAARRYPKKLWSDKSGSGRPGLVRCADEADEARQVCVRILEHHEAGTLLREQAVLVRTAHHSDLLELEMTARNIPFVKYGGLKFLEAAHVKDLLCILRLVENPRDELAWARVLALAEGIGPAIAARLSRELSGSLHPLALLEAPVTSLDASMRLPESSREEVAALAVALSDASGLGPDAAGPKVERAIRWLAPAVKRRYPNAEARCADLDQLQKAASGAPTLAKFLADITLDPPASTGDLAGPPLLDEDFVILSTIHSAKGCEWEVVHVIHASDGNIPSDMATGDAEAIEEERRLLYVAMTRARNHLYCYAPLRYHHRRFANDDPHSYGQLSRFFTPAVLRCMEESTATQRPSHPEDSATHESVGMARIDALIGHLWDS
ncbi:MAG: ATP-dependent helicase, partial [Actinomycetota bacterium]